ncbi:MAG TPA: peptidylprolyl isomerase [Segetibacter sp.]|jgi:peptidyl-prolyl cis-trans isomerase B (cyclophilin B)
MIIKHSIAFSLCIFFTFSSVIAQTKGKATAKKQTASKPAAVAAQKKDFSAPWMQMNSKERMLEITTDYGVMIAKLYDSTPLHRDNFVKLVQQKFYDSLLFHRVISQFMIQGGDPVSKNAADGVQLGGGSAPGERIPAEIKPYLFHKKGAFAAARDENPEKASSNCQFYIVGGKLSNEKELSDVYTKRVAAANPKFGYTNAQKEIYARIGGTPFLDQSYTVFGEVISGLDVVDKIASLPKDAANRPVQNVRMKIRLLN